MKSFTDIEQSKKLAKILPIGSADMAYIPSAEDDEGNTLYTAEYKSEIVIDGDDKDIINCWSLSALLEQFEDAAGLAKDYGFWFCYDNRKSYTKHYDNPIDACVELIVKLNEKGLM